MGPRRRLEGVRDADWVPLGPGDARVPGPPVRQPWTRRGRSRWPPCEVGGAGQGLGAEVSLAVRADEAVDVALPGLDGALACVEDGVLLEVAGHAGGRSLGQQRPRLLEMPAGRAGGVQAVVSDLAEALGEGVEEVAADELVSVEAHDAVPGAEGDLVGGDGDDAMVGDGDAVDVAGEVLQRMAYGSVAGGLDVDDPPLVALADQAQGAVEVGGFVAEVEEAGVEGFDEALEDATAVRLRDGLLGEEEVGAGGDPALAVEGQPTGGDQHVPVGVKREGAVPGVQHRGDAEAGPELLLCEVFEHAGAGACHEGVDE